MKILLITTTYPTPASPTQGVFNEDLVRALSAGHQVRVIAPVAWTQSLAAHPPAPDAVAVYPTWFYPPKVLRSLYGICYWWSIRRSLERLLSDFRPDVVLGYWTHPDGEAAVRAARRIGVPAVMLVGGSDVRILARRGRRRACVERVLRAADGVVTFSRDLAEHVRQLGARPDAVEVIYRGIDRTVFHPGVRTEARRRLRIPADSSLVLWVGRLVAVKHPELLIRAAVFWKTHCGSELQITIIGDGPWRRKLEQQARALRVADCCRFEGSLPHNQLADWYRAANVTVLTSHSEGVPNVLLESIACGTPFVATDVGGVREIATAGVDTLVPSGDQPALEQAVLRQLRANLRAPRAFEPEDLSDQATRLTAILERAVVSQRDRSREERAVLATVPAVYRQRFARSGREPASR